MASYDIEHSVPPSTSNTIPSSSSSSTSHPLPPRRPDFSTFFTHLSNTTPTPPTTSTPNRNPHATPMPTDISALYRLLADGYTSTLHSRPSPPSSPSSPLNEMITLLISEAETAPPPAGVTQEYIDGLERVPSGLLKRGGMGGCPICGVDFAEEEFPLVVRLPCDRAGRHVFDLECIAPWLRVHATCPLDRKGLGGVGRGVEEGEKGGKGEGEEEEEDGEWDDMYA